MRDFDAALEQRFFDIFKKYFDLEKDAGNQHNPANYTLDRMYPLAAVAGNPEKSLKIIHVAGTKGKGTTCHFMSALLASCGKRVGLFTSPHLSTVRERFQIDNELIDYETLIAAGESLVKAVDAAGLKPSLFELFTVMALRLFADAGVDYVVFETGIGGRLDATNYVQPVLTVIVPISFDHIALLGNTIEAIASEKAGILKPGVPLVLSRQSFPAAEKTILKRAHEIGSPVRWPVNDDMVTPFASPRWAPYLRENFATALSAVYQLGLNPDRSKLRIPALRARCEEIRHEPLVVLDAAHNGDSAVRLVEAMNKLYPNVHFTVVLGIVKGKDAHGIVSAMKKLNGEFILTNPHTGKGSDLDKLAEEMKEAGLNVREIIPQLTKKEQLPVGVPLLFTGSFFTALIGEEFFD
ncbi:MAG: hypothetical protein K5787_07565 [Lentisphaeria bacterium]|nr:hypothetical protein [Lentisphaeria bacterium]